MGGQRQRSAFDYIEVVLRRPHRLAAVGGDREAGAPPPLVLEGPGEPAPARPGAAPAAVAGTTGAITALRDRYPGLDGRTFSFSVIQSPSALGTLVAADDVLSVVLGELGMRLPDTLAARPGSAPGTGIVALGPEQLTDLAADLVIVVAPDPAAADALLADPRAATLAPGGQLHTMDLVTATALRTPSVLSRRWGLEQLDAPLAAVAG